VVAHSRQCARERFEVVVIEVGREVLVDSAPYLEHLAGSDSVVVDIK
jgi:hypothetical protein